MLIYVVFLVPDVSIFHKQTWQMFLSKHERNFTKEFRQTYVRICLQNVLILKIK